MTKHIGLLFILLACVSVQAIADIRGLQRSGDANETGTYRALVIGNNEYEDPQGNWVSLNTAVNDAKTVVRVLKEKYNFTDVDLLLNGTRADIIKAMNRLSQRVERDDHVLVYYAGHGYMDKARNRGYWIPVDAVGTDMTTYIRNSTIRDELALIAETAQHTLLVSDSCFSGSLLRADKRGIKLKEQELPGYYAKIAKKKSVQVFAAGGQEFVDDNYRNSGHSPFTYFLLNELDNNANAFISLSELGTNVAKAVANNVQQTPELGVLYGAGDELGDFIFAQNGVANVAAPGSSRIASFGQGHSSPPALPFDDFVSLPRM